MNRAAAFSILFILSLGDARSQECRPTVERESRESDQTVQLLPLPTEPSFYYRAADFVVFLPQDAVRSYFEKLEHGTDAEGRRVAREVLSDLPLSGHLDLFSYSLRDWLFENYIEFAVVQLIQDGHASISNLGGLDMREVFIKHVHKPEMSFTEVRIADQTATPILSRLECISD